MGKGPRIDCSKDVPLTQQSAKDECDINKIIERLKKGADVPNASPNPPRYGDFASIPTDLRECLLVVRQADELFMSLDAHVRKRFDNDPAKLLDFLNDANNRSEAVKLGLVDAPPEPVTSAPEEPVAAPTADSGAKKAKAKPVDA